MRKVVPIDDARGKREQDLANKLQKKQNEVKKLKESLKRYEKQIGSLTLSLDTIHGRYLEAAQASVDLLEELENYRYRARFVNISIQNISSYRKLELYRKHIVSYFTGELKSIHIAMGYTGINEQVRRVLTLSRRKSVSQPSFDVSSCKRYYIELVDILFPERKIGHITVGRHPYRDPAKERAYHRRITDELYYVKRVIENQISDIHNKELAVKDALTGLYNRKFLEEKLADEFNSIDYFHVLEPVDREVLGVIMQGDGNPYSVLRNRFFLEYGTKDEEVFRQAVGRLKDGNLISSRRDRYLGELMDHYFFENSKKAYNLFVAMFDLDHFKDVNDNWGGHGVGDRVLMDFAGILKRFIRTTDIPVRQGGEEFVVIFPRADSQMKIKEVLERIRMACEEKLVVRYRGNTRNVTVSIGLTRISRFDHTPLQVLTRVDAALYAAKKIRNKLVIYEQGVDAPKRVEY